MKNPFSLKGVEIHYADPCGGWGASREYVTVKDYEKLCKRANKVKEELARFRHHNRHLHDFSGPVMS